MTAKPASSPSRSATMTARSGSVIQAPGNCRAPRGRSGGRRPRAGRTEAARIGQADAGGRLARRAAGLRGGCCSRPAGNPTCDSSPAAPARRRARHCGPRARHAGAPDLDAVALSAHRRPGDVEAEEAESLSRISRPRCSPPARRRAGRSGRRRDRWRGRHRHWYGPRRVARPPSDRSGSVRPCRLFNVPRAQCSEWAQWRRYGVDGLRPKTD